jgi:multiple sugar transport system permease protein
MVNEFPQTKKGFRKYLRFCEPYFFLIPAVCLLGLIYLYPLADLIRTSFYKAHTLVGRTEFVGLQNYYNLLNRETLDILWKTLVWAGLSTPATMLIGLLGALLLNHDFRGKNILKVLAFIPWTIPHAMIAVFWKWLIHPYYGILNHMLKVLGVVKEPINFLSKTTALYSAIGARIWKGAPFALITLLAALQTIPKEYYEAAEVDGARKITQFFHITLPMIKGVFLSTSLMTMIWAVVTFYLFLEGSSEPQQSFQLNIRYAHLDRTTVCCFFNLIVGLFAGWA